MPKKFNDVLALIVVIGLPALILYSNAAKIGLPGEVVGAFLASITLVVQFYFRKAEPK